MASRPSGGWANKGVASRAPGGVSAHGHAVEVDAAIASRASRIAWLIVADRSGRGGVPHAPPRPMPMLPSRSGEARAPPRYGCAKRVVESAAVDARGDRPVAA